jgi:deoxyadenosine/deoxycytidine kinase
MYILEGNIGAGKSTFLQLLTNRLPQCHTSTEPVENWQNKNLQHSLLENFYTDPHRWAYTMESFTLSNRVKEHLKDQKLPDPRIIERSIYSGFYCFAQNSYESGFLQPIEWAMYTQTFETLVHNHCKPPRGFIYLRTTPQVSFLRVKKRSRSEESTVLFTYLEQIHTKHDDFLLHKKNVDPRIAAIPVLTLDCDHDFEHDHNFMDYLIEKVRLFMAQTSSTI